MILYRTVSYQGWPRRLKNNNCFSREEEKMNGREEETRRGVEKTRRRENEENRRRGEGKTRRKDEETYYLI
jgi:hypothetical protein